MVRRDVRALRFKGTSWMGTFREFPGVPKRPLEFNIVLSEIQPFFGSKELNYYCSGEHVINRGFQKG